MDRAETVSLPFVYLKKGQLPILVYGFCLLTVCATLFLRRADYEFLMYVGVLAFFFVVIIATNRRVRYPNAALWGLAIWGTLHMMGGAIYIKEDTVLYSLMLLPISEKYHIFRYDQFVHIVGFGVGTYVMFCLLQLVLQPDLRRWTALSIVVIMAGLGVGALNEIVEFVATIVAPKTNVGGYVNTSLDLVADLVGAVLVMIIIRVAYMGRPVAIKAMGS